MCGFGDDRKVSVGATLVWGVPLGSSDQVFESGVESFPLVGVGLPVGFAEYGFVGWSGDVPALFVYEPVVVSADEDQIVQVCGSSVCPVLSVVDFEPVVASASGEPALSAVPMVDETT